MPRTRRPEAFGPEYPALLSRAFEATRNGSDFTLQLATPNLSASLRSKCYAYFAALRAQAPDSDFARMADSLSLRCAGSALVAFRSEDAWDACAIRDALGLERGFGNESSSGLLPTTPNPHVEQLASIRMRKKS